MAHLIDAPGVTYTYAPMIEHLSSDGIDRLAYRDEKQTDSEASELFDPSARRRQRQADARLRRAVRQAWTDPNLAKGDCIKALPVHASLRDVQGVAGLLMARAEARMADSHYAAYPGTLGTSHWIQARIEFSQSAALYGAMLNDPKLYSLSRQSTVHAALSALTQRKTLQWCTERKDMLAAWANTQVPPEHHRHHDHLHLSTSINITTRCIFRSPSEICA